MNQKYFTQTTEAPSLYDNLEKMPVSDLLKSMNDEDKKVPDAVAQSLPQIEAFVTSAYERMREGGRLFYIGAGTSGRLGILDASEIPPTYGAPTDWIIGLIAGGDHAIRNAVEFAEDDEEQAWKDLKIFNPDADDILLGIAASGRTPYVIGGLRRANTEGLLTGCIVCNTGSPVAEVAQCPIEVVVGPEFVTGSTRMKSGTATKLVLNMISTSLMIKMGRVKGNRMVDMQLTNKKLVHRGVRMVMFELGVDEEMATALLNQHGSVRQVIDSFKRN
ncbi:MAG: N-acetylmuramic acid 6-phosphate etherase [Saprospiraceae bacterium]|nr:N-acetylmuramic acid 6-phosphate etherase [Saprospiraceae bacterium]